jgi:hypothetical protein
MKYERPSAATPEERKRQQSTLRDGEIPGRGEQEANNVELAEVRKSIQMYSQQLRSVWDSLPPDVKEEAIFVELSHTFRGNVDEFVRSMRQSSGSPQVWTEHHIVSDLKQMRDRAFQAIIQ